MSNTSAAQRAAQQIQNQDSIKERKQQFAYLKAIIYLAHFALLTVGYVIAIFMWWKCYKQNKIAIKIWAIISIAWIGTSSFIYLTLISIQAIPTGGGATLIAIPLLFAPLLTEYHRGLVFVLRKMKPETLQEQVERLTRETETREQSQSKNAGNTTLSNQKDIVSIGKILRSDQFPPEFEVTTKNGTIGISKNSLYKNTLIVGAVGSGKTTLLLRLIEQIATNTPLDIYLIDGKGDEDLAQQTASLIYSIRNQQTPIFRIGSGKRGAVYNPFAGSEESIFNRLCNLAGVQEQTGIASYYGKRNTELLQLITYAPQGAPRSFEDLRERLQKSWLLNAYAQDPITRKEIQDISDKALEELQLTLRGIARMFTPLTGKEGFLIEASRSAIFSLATGSAGTTSKEFVNMLIEDIKDAMRNRITHPCIWIVDEFLVLGNDSVRDILTIGRSFGMGVILAMQDIDAITDDRTKNLMLSNCRTKIIMANDKPETLAKAAGTRKAIEVGMQLDEGASTGMSSARMQDQYLIDPNEIRGLHTGECFLLRQGKMAKLKVSSIGTIPQNPQAELKIVKTPQQTTPEQPKQPDPINLTPASNKKRGARI